MGTATAVGVAGFSVDTGAVTARGEGCLASVLPAVLTQRSKAIGNSDDDEGKNDWDDD